MHLCQQAFSTLYCLNIAQVGEYAPGSRVYVSAQAVDGSGELRARLLLDCMGHYSPIVKQIRGGKKPEGMVLVVGSCADGVLPENNTCAHDRSLASRVGLHRKPKPQNF